MEIEAVYGLGGTNMTLDERFTLIAQLAAAQAAEVTKEARQRVRLWKMLQQQQLRILNSNNANPEMGQTQRLKWINKPAARRMQTRPKTQQNMRVANGLPRNALPRNGVPRNGFPRNGLPRNGVRRYGAQFQRNYVQNRPWQRRPWTAQNSIGAQKRRLAAAAQRRRLQTFWPRRNAMRGGAQWNRTKVTREQLDKELDQYMNCTKAALDKQLEAYMADAI